MTREQLRAARRELEQARAALREEWLRTDGSLEGQLELLARMELILRQEETSE